MKYDLTGYEIDALVKRLHEKGFVLKDVVRPDFKHISFTITDKDVKRIKKYIANFKVKQTFSMVKRLPKFLLLNVGCVLGVIVGCVFASIANNYLWRIEIYGLKNLSRNEIISILKDNGVKVGGINSKSKQEIEDILLKSYDRLAQVSVVKIGTSVVINLSEKLVYNPINFKPIIAKYNGIISSIEIKTGTVNCRVGDYVNVGDVLVLPFNLDAQGNQISVEPKANICGTIFVVSKEVLPKTTINLVRSGKMITVYDYSLFNKHIFYGKSRNSFALFECLSYNENVVRYSPFKRKVVKYFELNEVEVTHDFDKEKQQLVDKSYNLAKGMLPENCNIVAVSQSTSVEQNMMIATTILESEGQING